MKKTAFTIVLVIITLVALMLGRANAGDISLYGEDLYDSEGYNYGVNYYADNNTGSDLYAVVYITSQENVNGDCVYGMILLAPYESHVLVGSFATADYDYGWSVNISANYGSSPEQVDAPPY